MKAYTLTMTGWRMLVAMRDSGRDMAAHTISTAAGVHKQSVYRELRGLDTLGLIVSRPRTPLYKLTAKGLTAANGPCPTRVVPIKAERVAPQATPGEPVTGLTSGERLALEHAAAHPGKSVAQIAAAENRTPGALRKHLRALSVRGLVLLPGPGLHQVPTVTETGAARLTKPEPARKRYSVSPLPAPRPAEDAPAEPKAPEEAPPVPVAFTGDRKTPGFRGIRHPSLDSLGYKPGRAAPSIAGWS